MAVDEPGTRHISIRVPTSTYTLLQAHAHERGETLSQTTRQLIEGGLAPGGRDAIDAAIAALQLARHELAEHAHSVPVGASDHEPARVVNVLNVKTNLSRLLADVGRGDEIVISHAGQPRARLVPVEPAPSV